MHPFNELKLPSGGKILLTPCPGTKDEALQESLSTLQNAGASCLVTMMPQHEIESVGVEALPVKCQSLGLAWHHLPVEDDCPPQEPFAVAFEQARGPLLERLSNKETVAIHCRGGTGRTSLMAATLMLELGLSWPQAEAILIAAGPKYLRIPGHRAHLQNKYTG